MVAANIKVILRVRPSARPSKGFSADVGTGVVNFDLEKRSADGQVDNTKTHFKFKFDGILPMQVTQQDVFEQVAKPVIDDVLQGINGTIFAYGQTGSGKTFTITGGAERYDDRGLIPRTITYLFDTFKQNPGCKYSLYISYLEIYNNDGYDLLSRDDAAKLEDLPKVVLREDEEGNIKLRNLSVNMAQKEEDALNLLFLGDTNRVVAETPMNDASTRSHCMFIMWVESSQPGTDTIRRAKLHLVDLAGSERIGKTGVEGKLRTEATSINLSLHYLEQVIVALHDRAQGRRQHVPYRNSVLTSVLRDSLGGNCKTLMVGGIAAEDANLEESISTCRFAQRVASIKNNAVVNEELDPALMIRRLKKEVSQLKDELAMLSADGDGENAAEVNIEECQKMVNAYLEEADAEAPFVCGSMARFRKSFEILRQMLWQCGAHPHERRVEGGGAPSRKSVELADNSRPPEVGSLEATVLELRQQKARRDEEIGMLLSSISKRSTKGRAPVVDGPVFIKGASRQEVVARPETLGTSQEMSAHAIVQGVEQNVSNKQDIADATALLLDRNKAFEVFRKSVRRRQGMQESQEHQMKLVEEARNCGQAANAAREAINARKTRMERLRMERAILKNPRGPDSQTVPMDGPEVAQLMHEIEEQKRIYHQSTERLRQVKLDIDSYKSAKQQSEERMRKDFESWYKSVCASQGVQIAFAEEVDVGAVASHMNTSDLERSSITPPLDGSTGQNALAYRSSASVCSMRSEADTSARATPVVSSRPKPPSVVISSTSPERHQDSPLVVVSAWVAPCKPAEVGGRSAAVAEGARPTGAAPQSTAGASTRRSQTQPSTSGPPTAAAVAVPSSVKMTGDQQTDDSILAYYEALAALNG